MDDALPGTTPDLSSQPTYMGKLMGDFVSNHLSDPDPYNDDWDDLTGLDEDIAEIQMEDQEWPSITISTEEKGRLRRPWKKDIIIQFF